MNPQDAFVARLRRHRERNRISVDDIAAATCIDRELLEAFEATNLSEWPRGIYARAWVRAYASVVGLDPSDTVDEFCRLFPHGDRRAAATLHEMAAIVAHPSEYRDERDRARDRRRHSPRVNVLPEPSWYTAVGRWAQVLWWRVVVPLSPGGNGQRLKGTPRTST
ncbi:MAG: helix-turn-helix domain-containing protein [Acidobacteria bacterium]|nr:helix-turn-helix domain-containing protein [Acidobacteriota bacterium]